MSKLTRQRRTHSTLDGLPSEIMLDVDAMIIDGIWPDGIELTDNDLGTPTYDDIVSYLKRKGHNISRSAVGRYAARLMVVARMKHAGLIARDVMKDLTGEKASETQKAAVEMITAHAIDMMAGMDEMKPKDLLMVAGAMRDCAAVAIKSDQYIREQIKAKTEKAVAEVSKQLKKQIDPETLKIIKEQIYGIIEK